MIVFLLEDVMFYSFNHSFKNFIVGVGIWAQWWRCCFSVPGLSPDSTSWSSFLVLYFLGSGRLWLTYLTPCQLHGRCLASSWLLDSAPSSPSCGGYFGERTSREVAGVFVCSFVCYCFLCLCLSHKFFRNLLRKMGKLRFSLWEGFYFVYVFTF